MPNHYKVYSSQGSIGIAHWLERFGQDQQILSSVLAMLSTYCEY